MNQVSPGTSDAPTLVGVGGASFSWYALHTNFQHEKVVARILTQKGFEVFLPLYDAAHRWKDRTKQLSLPLFPCYVFIQGGLDRRLQILGTPGVHGFVGWSGRAAPIPEQEIEAVLRMIESSLKVEPHPFLKCGDWVRVKSGPLEGIEGILVRKKNLFRLVLSVEMVQQSVAVEVDVTAVESVARPRRGACSYAESDPRSGMRIAPRASAFRSDLA